RRGSRGRGPNCAARRGEKGHAALGEHRLPAGRADHVRRRVRGDALAFEGAAAGNGRRAGGEAPMAVMNMIQALNSAHDIMLEREENMVVLGEDVGYFGGVFRVTEGLQKKFGTHRVFDTPITENGIVATAIGMAAYGLKPVAEIQFADYIYPAYDQIVSEAARIRYRTAGEWTVPMVIRSPYGGGIFGGQTHSQSTEALSA